MLVSEVLGHEEAAIVGGDALVPASLPKVRHGRRERMGLDRGQLRPVEDS